MNRMLTTLCSAAVAMTTCSFADMPTQQQKNPCACLEQGMGLPTEKKCFPAAYNAPASIATSCSWDFDVFASFLYWHVSQEDMDIAHAAMSATQVGAVAYQNFDYKPGFKLGVGFDTNYDDWVGWVEYTWMHQTTSSSYSPPAQTSGATGSWASQDWFINYLAVLGSPNGLVSSSWKMNLDMLDAVFSRPYYQGTQLTMSPYAGLRSLWLRQRLKVNLAITASPGFAYAINQSHAWSIGPVGGMMGHWLIGQGLRFEGNAGGSLLYMQYTSVGHKELDSGTTVLTAGTSDLNALRPTTEFGVGLGWGSYYSCQQFYFDVSARYDFMVLWNQNVLRQLVGNLAGYTEGPGNLYLHGLTVSARFDF